MNRKLFLIKMLGQANNITTESKGLASLQAGNIKQECAKAVLKGIITENDYKVICEAITNLLESI